MKFALTRHKERLGFSTLKVESESDSSSSDDRVRWALRSFFLVRRRRFEDEFGWMTMDLELQTEGQLSGEGVWHSLWNDTFPFLE